MAATRGSALLCQWVWVCSVENKLHHLHAAAGRDIHLAPPLLAQAGGMTDTYSSLPVIKTAWRNFLAHTAVLSREPCWWVPERRKHLLACELREGPCEEKMAKLVFHRWEDSRIWLVKSESPWFVWDSHHALNLVKPPLCCLLGKVRA